MKDALHQRKFFSIYLLLIYTLSPPLTEIQSSLSHFFILPFYAHNIKMVRQIRLQVCDRLKSHRDRLLCQSGDSKLVLPDPRLILQPLHQTRPFFIRLSGRQSLDPTQFCVWNKASCSSILPRKPQKPGFFSHTSQCFLS